MSVVKEVDRPGLGTRVLMTGTGVLVSSALVCGLGQVATSTEAVGQPTVAHEVSTTTSTGIEDFVINPVIRQGAVRDAENKVAAPAAVMQSGLADRRRAATILPASFWGRTWDYTQCIVGAGVPLGVAIYFAAEIGTRIAFNALLNINRSIIPGVSGPMMRWYAQQVWNACSRFINS
ncbi:hypothetical protein [Nakamurella endophytica]|uniref:Uncharacterized protein n=1 Tax=Nakamurella endophytica TaxID=1748367 RepID=A0A917TAN6_9ACTN|nr:hypothetical protein [Nakamurella endophytica]GGM16049.1 hypothetical protein GCM10011594_40070 [Nakamurella endophytica]